MKRHADFERIYGRFVAQYGAGSQARYSAWLEKKGYDEMKAFPRSVEMKELLCKVIGFELKETPTEYHIEGLVATTHIDKLDSYPDINVPDKIPKETLDSWAVQINTLRDAQLMGVHHSEGHPFNPEFFGEADVENNPAKVIPLMDKEWGLFVDTKLLKDDPATPGIIERFESGELNSFSVTYNTDGFMTTDFDWIGDDFVRVLNPETKLFGYTAASNPVNPEAIAMNHGFKEFKELVGKSENTKKEVVDMTAEIETKEDKAKVEPVDQPSKEEGAVEENIEKSDPPSDKPADVGLPEDKAEEKEFREWKMEKKLLEEKEKREGMIKEVTSGVLKKMEVKEKVLKDGAVPAGTKEVSLEIKAFREILAKPAEIEIKEQFRRVAAASDDIGLDWRESTTPLAESREFKNFGVNGTKLEFKGLGITTNQNADTDYLQSSAELQDVYDPVIYNALNQATVTWNLLAKDNFSGRGNNQVQFTLKIAANASAAFYTGNSVSSDNVGRLKYQTKFKKVQVGVTVDGDMIAAARGGPVSDVFAQEILDSTMDMLAVINAALFAEAGLETVAACIGFEYITDSAGNTTLYNLTRSTTNLLSPASAADTYINQSSTIISMTNLRGAKRQALNEGANKQNLVFITNPVQADLLRGKFDDSRRMLTARNTDFGFSTDLFVDGIPVFEDTDCNTDDWWLVDLETHRVGMWVPPTIERLGKTADSEDAFVKTYFATYNRAPRRLVQIYGCATS